MSKKILIVFLSLCFIASNASYAVQGKAKAVQKKTVKVKTVVKKAVKPAAVKPAPVKVEKKVQAEDQDKVSIEDQVQDVKDDTNTAISNLKAQVDKLASDNSDIKVGSVIFFRWQKYLSNGGTNVNNFDIDRAYLDFKKKLDWGASARVTLDVARISTSLDTTKSTQNLFDYLKYAYVELPFNVSLLSQFVPFSASAKIGLQHTVWIDWADKMLNLRYIAKSLTDNEGAMTSADFGVGLTGKISPLNMPEVEYHATLLNGSGYKAVDADGKKNIALRLNSTIFNSPLGGVILGVFGSLNGATPSNLTGDTNQDGAMLGLKSDSYTFYGELLNGTGIKGYSVGGIYEVLPGFKAFARTDEYDPNFNKANDQIDRVFYGMTYDWGKDVKFSVDVQNATGGSAASTSAGKTTSVLYVHSMVTL